MAAAGVRGTASTAGMEAGPSAATVRGIDAERGPPSRSHADGDARRANQRGQNAVHEDPTPDQPGKAARPRPTPARASRRHGRAAERRPTRRRTRRRGGRATATAPTSRRPSSAPGRPRSSALPASRPARGPQWRSRSRGPSRRAAASRSRRNARGSYPDSPVPARRPAGVEFPSPMAATTAPCPRRQSRTRADREPQDRQDNEDPDAGTTRAAPRAAAKRQASGRAAPG